MVFTTDAADTSVTQQPVRLVKDSNCQSANEVQPPINSQGRGGVTGANKGIGNGIVELLARSLEPISDWHIYLTARNEKLGLEAVKTLEEKGLSVKFHQLDITDADSRHRLANFIKDNYPDGIDILVNNAGIAYKHDSTAPFGEQARVTIATNYTATVQMCIEFLPLMGKDSRLVNVASLAAMMSLRAMSKEMAAKFKSQLTLHELDELMASFIRHAEVGDHEKVGFSGFAYGMAEVGVWKVTGILAEQFKSDPRHILINSCCPGYVDTDLTNHKGYKTILEGAGTPVYLATLPKGATEPYGQFVSERQVVNVDKECPL
ncbi:Carbonyl reductase NADPH 3 [Taenia crassiceps]|uniref:carbonyl reductase (NADPH) n=1 Tax=Taenia crassiceps TaxID=6207 RepID=A0ABR4QI20_9CEST